MVSQPAPAHHKAPRASALWLAALSIGLAAGLADVVHLMWSAQGRTSDGLGPHMLWMTPLSTLLWFLLAALILAPLRQRLSYAAGVGALIGLATLSLLLRNPRIHITAVLLIAIGVAVQATRLLRQREQATAGVFKRLALPLVLTIAILGAGVTLLERGAERRALAALPPPSSHVNVLLLVLDTVRAMDLSLYALDHPTTPGLERWARDGVVFDWAFATAPWTLPSHASLFTGRPAHELSTNWNQPLDERDPTLAEVLRGRGYVTAGFVANLLFLNRDWGIRRGFSHYEDNPIAPGELLVSGALGLTLQGIRPLRRVLGYHEIPARKSAADLNHDLLAWLDRQSGERPFFAFINYYDAHQPYLPPPAYDRRFATSGQPRAHYYDYSLHEVGYQRDRQFTAMEYQREREAYQATIAYLDDELDRLFSELQRRTLLDRTIVIVTSDHGEHFGEYGLNGHGNSLYTQLTRVPLLLRYPPAIPSGSRIAAPVSLDEVPATVLDLTRGGGIGDFPGFSLARYWGARPPADTTPVLMSLRLPNHDLIRGLVVGSHHLVVQSREGQTGLFDLSKDPLEAKSLAADTALTATMVHLHAMLDSLIPDTVPGRKGPAA